MLIQLQQFQRVINTRLICLVTEMCRVFSDRCYVAETYMEPLVFRDASRGQ